MKVFVVGGGGREHTLAWKLSGEDIVKAVYAAPGNPGIEAIGTCVPINVDDIYGLADYAGKERMDLTVVGPEAPLNNGIVDEFEKRELTVFGPTGKASQIESNKRLSKELMRKYDIPTAFFEPFTDYDKAVAYAESCETPFWIKASGLAAGKGAIVANSHDEARKILHRVMVERVFGESGDTVVIEENLIGEEASVLALTDGETFIPLVSSQDHKRIGDGDTGLNTGGMGAYAPAPVTSGDMMERISKEILEPTIHAMAAEGRPYKGVLYAGIMINENCPSVVEFNCRFGDPESQVVLPLMESSLAELMLAVSEGNLKEQTLREKDGAAVCVVMASGGYPESYRKGYEITGLREAGSDDNVVVFHAGTKRDRDRIITNGGRVLGVTGVGNNFVEAREKAYKAVEKIHFKNAVYRTDIGYRALERLPGS